MNWDQVEGKWKEVAGKAKEKWGKLTDDDWTTIRGKRDQLIGKVQERYGIAKQEAEKQVDEFANTVGSGSTTEERKRSAGQY
ncbi:MAG TPA: CsbD family protein [Candidatus Eremiobacteraceae bacterium]|nr:CsbD family protein [Candidatus Eremiobacteraceae bacterium]